MNTTTALAFFKQFATEISDPVAAATLAGSVYQAERLAETTFQPDSLWDVAQAASFLYVSEKTVRRMVNQGTLRKAPLSELGGVLRFVPSEVRRAAISEEGSGSMLDDL